MWILTKCIPSFRRNLNCLSIRTLFSERMLGLPAFEETRYRLQNVNKISDSQVMYVIQNASNEQLVSSTIKYIHCVTNKPGEIDLLRHCFKRIGSCDQSETPFKFGPLMMRMFHLLNMPKEALQFYNDFDGKMFRGRATVLILLDLLFNNGLYLEMLELHEKYRRERDREPSNLHNVFTFAACYKLNTPEHLELALSFWNSFETGLQLSQGRNFLAMLAINQQKPDVALKILPEKEEYTSTVNVKLMALAELNEFNAICDIILSIKNRQLAEKRCIISAEVFHRIREALDKDRSIPFWGRYDRVLTEYQHLIGLFKPLMDEILCWPINIENTNKLPIERSAGHLTERKFYHI